MSCNKFNNSNLDNLAINECNGFEVEDIPKYCQNSNYTGIVCNSDNKPNGCFGVNSCEQGTLFRLNNCIDCNDKDLMTKATYARRQYISSTLPVNQPKYYDLQFSPTLNPEYQLSESFTNVKSQSDRLNNMWIGI